MDKERSGERMKLGAFFHPTGNHVAAWLHPDAQIDAGTNFRHYAEITQTAERGKFDLMFVADAVATRDGKLEALSRWPQYMAYFDPLTLLPALATVTTHIGLCATATTSYNEPYHIARKFASLDHISGGRAGWNVVTSSNVSEAFNFGRERHYEHDAHPRTISRGFRSGMMPGDGFCSNGLLGKLGPAVWTLGCSERANLGPTSDRSPDGPGTQGPRRPILYRLEIGNSGCENRYSHRIFARAK